MRIFIILFIAFEFFVSSLLINNKIQNIIFVIWRSSEKKREKKNKVNEKIRLILDVEIYSILN